MSIPPIWGGYEVDDFFRAAMAGGVTNNLNAAQFGWRQGETSAEAFAASHGQKKPASKPPERLLNPRPAPEPDAPRSRPDFADRVLDRSSGVAVFRTDDAWHNEPADLILHALKDRSLMIFVPLRRLVRGGRVSINGVSP